MHGRTGYWRVYDTILLTILSMKLPSLIRFYDGNSIFNLTVCCSEFSLPPSPGEAELQWNIGLACNTYNEYMYAFSVDGAIGQRRPLWSSACRDVPPTHRIGDCQLVSSLWGRKGVYANTMATVPSGSIINEVARRYDELVGCHVECFTGCDCRYRPSRKEEWKLYICEIEKGTKARQGVLYE